MAPANRLSFIHDGVVVDTSSEHHGVSFFPPPSADKRDPLRWPQWVKVAALLSTSFVNFCANFAGAGLSVAAVVLEMQFHKTKNEVNSLLTYNFLLLGIGNLFWVPLAVKYGKRAIMLISTALLFAVLVWTAKAETFTELLIARCISGFASAAGESIVPGIISDIFFFHERATMVAVYVILISSGSAVGPLVSGFVVAKSPSTWRDAVWITAAITGFNLLALFIFYPESSFDRPPIQDDLGDVSDGKTGISEIELKDSYKTSATYQETVREETRATQNGTVPVSFPRVWMSFIRVDHDLSFITMFCRPLFFLMSPLVIWTIFLYGSSLASQIILIFAFPSLLLAPPYLFDAASVGLMEIAAVIGFVIACYGSGYMSDIITVRRVIKKGGQVIPEQRLVSLIPGCAFGPAGCILLAFACEHKLHWAIIAAGFGLVSFGTVYAPNIAITYLLDSYPAFASEILVVVNVSKNLVAFLFLFTAVDWINSQGYIQVYIVMFGIITASLLAAIPLYFFGGNMRKSLASRFPSE